jgi:hypothetical protein
LFFTTPRYATIPVLFKQFVALFTCIFDMIFVKCKSMILVPMLLRVCAAVYVSFFGSGL